MLQIKQVDQHQGAERPLSVLRFLTAPGNLVEEGETALSGLGTLCSASGFATGTCSLRAIGISNKPVRVVVFCPGTRLCTFPCA